MVVALADQAPTSARNKPKTPPDSKTNYVAAFFDSIGPSWKSDNIRFRAAIGDKRTLVHVVNL